MSSMRYQTDPNACSESNNIKCDEQAAWLTGAADSVAHTTETSLRTLDRTG